jgi:hypothetical protein
MKLKARPSPLMLKSKIFLIIKERGEQGASIEEIDFALIPEYHIPRRTLQRRLEEMQPGMIVAKGEARATRYYVSTAGDIAIYDAAKETLSRSIPTKNQGRPIAHQRQFLGEYEPQKTNYLSNDHMKSLASPGKTFNSLQSADTSARRILPRFLADLSYNSCRLEDNPYSLSEVQQLIQSGMQAADKTVKETQMIVNHKQAIEFIINAEEEAGINKHTLTNLHAILSDNLLPSPGLYGSLRSSALKLERSSYMPPNNPRLIQEMFEMILEKAALIEDPFEQSFFLLVHLSYLQPFGNANNQLSRVAMNIPLVKNNLSPVSFAGVSVDRYNQALSEVYELNSVDLLRGIFISAYNRSSELYADYQLATDPVLFAIKYSAQIRSIVSRIVKGAFTPDQASILIKEKSFDIEEEVRAKFIEYVNTELQSLHEGNFGRFSIDLDEFKAWDEFRKK